MGWIAKGALIARKIEFTIEIFGTCIQLLALQTVQMVVDVAFLNGQRPSATTYQHLSVPLHYKMV